MAKLKHRRYLGDVEMISMISRSPRDTPREVWVAFSSKQWQEKALEKHLIPSFPLEMYFHSLQINKERFTRSSTEWDWHCLTPSVDCSGISGLCFESLFFTLWELVNVFIFGGEAGLEMVIGLKLKYECVKMCD